MGLVSIARPLLPVVSGESVGTSFGGRKDANTLAFGRDALYFAYGPVVAPTLVPISAGKRYRNNVGVLPRTCGTSRNVPDGESRADS